MEVASSAMVDSSLSRYFFKEVRSLDVRPDTILVMSWRTETIPSAPPEVSFLPSSSVGRPVAVVPPLLPEDRKLVMSTPLLRICSGYSLRVERSMSAI